MGTKAAKKKPTPKPAPKAKSEASVALAAAIGESTAELVYEAAAKLAAPPLAGLDDLPAVDVKVSPFVEAPIGTLPAMPTWDGAVMDPAPVIPDSVTVDGVDFTFEPPGVVEIPPHLAGYMATVEADLAAGIGSGEGDYTVVTLHVGDAAEAPAKPSPTLRWHRTDTASTCPLGGVFYVRDGVWAVKVGGEDRGTVSSREKGEKRVRGW